MTDQVDPDADYIELLRASDPVEALKRENERLKAEIARITGERESPHCSTCACGLAPEPPVNQCDGCRRGLSVDLRGYHVGPGQWDMQICTADRYSSQPPSGICSAHQHGEDPQCRFCYPTQPPGAGQ